MQTGKQILSACPSILLTAPAAVHRILFRRNVKDEIVDMTAGLVKLGMLCLAVAMLTAVTFVVAFVGGVEVACILSGALAAVVVTTWLLLPHVRRHRTAQVRNARVDLRPPTRLARG